MKILLSAYACAPGVGSEQGVGWNWAIGLARANHNVWVLTRSLARKSIEAACSEEPHPNLCFVYYDYPSWFWSLGIRSQQLRYQAWQWCAFRTAADLQTKIRFDVIHHITFGVWRHHSLLPLLDAPFMFGPVGGGEAAPVRLRKSFPVRYQMRELMRDAANHIATLDPLLRMNFRRAALIPCKTADTVQFIPAKYRQKCVVHGEIGAPPIVAPSPRQDKSEFRVLFAGNLLPLKGIHLALRAVAIASSRVPTIRFTIAGSGPLEPRLRRLAAKLGIEKLVAWPGKIAQSELFELYAQADVFLFPSLHDSSGNVVMESLSRGLPVVCLDLGGPAQFIDASCGRVIATPGRTEEQVSSDLAEALCALAGDEVLHGELRQGAIRKAEDLSWDAVIGGLYEKISNLVGQRTEDGPLLPQGTRSEPEMHKVLECGVEPSIHPPSPHLPALTE